VTTKPTRRMREALPHDPQSDAGQLYGDYAGFATRLVAFAIDVILVLITIGIFALFGRLLGNFLLLQGMTRSIFLLTIGLAAISINVGYFVLFWSLAGYTPGKRIMGLLVVKVNGERVSAGMALRRYLGYYLSAILMLGYLWIIIDPRRQGWHDKLANTVVLYNWPDRILLTAAASRQAETERSR
jgi:uncharacterized RDD family membrane protein YckC